MHEKNTPYGGKFSEKIPPMGVFRAQRSWKNTPYSPVGAKFEQFFSEKIPPMSSKSRILSSEIRFLDDRRPWNWNLFFNLRPCIMKFRPRMGLNCLILREFRGFGAQILRYQPKISDFGLKIDDEESIN